MHQDVTKDDRDIVSALADRLADKVGQERFELWFAGQARLALGEGCLVVGAANQFVQDLLRRQFRPALETVAREVLGPEVRVEFTLDSKHEGAVLGATSLSPREPARLQPVERLAVDRAPVEAPRLLPFARPAVNAPNVTALASPLSGATLSGASVSPAPNAPADPRQSGPAGPAPRTRSFATFETFVVGDANRLAHTSAELLISGRARVSPLLLHGPTGVGKTHLLEAIWSAARARDRQARIVFRTAEQFTTEFVGVVREKRGHPSFRNKYRGVEVLLVDNVQFFAGKKATLGEFVQTLDALVNLGKAVALASDRSPAELAQSIPELATRLSGGMVCRVDVPDYTTRLGIVRRLASRLAVVLPAEVESFLAERFTNHAWELAGAVNRLYAASLAHRRAITREMAEDTLADLLRDAARIVRLADIEQAVCTTFGLSPDALHTDRKARGTSHPRMLAMWLARKHTRAAYSEIGQFFGKKSHSTVISAERRISACLADQDRLELADRAWHIEDAIRAVEQRLSVG